MRVLVPQMLPANQVHMSIRYPRQRWEEGGQGKTCQWGAHQAMKKKMLAANSRLPKSPNTQPTTLGSIRLGGNEIRSAPCCAARRCASAALRPVSRTTAKRWSASSGDMLCQSRSDRSKRAFDMKSVRGRHSGHGGFKEMARKARLSYTWRLGHK